VIPHNLPDYVERGGRQVWRPPYTARGAELFGFVLQAGRGAIDELLARDLVEPAQGAVDYRCANDRVVVVFAQIEHLASDDSRDQHRGYLCEREVSVWCLAADMTAGTRLVWYLPYVFVDSGQAVASGREVYGYPKQMGSFAKTFPRELAEGGTTIVEAPAIDPFGPDEKAEPRPMITAERLAQKPGDEAVVREGTVAFNAFLDYFRAWLDISDELPFGPPPPQAAVITPITSPPPSGAGPPPRPPWAARRPLHTLRGRGLAHDSYDLIVDMVANPTLVFLKQFRDASCPTKACYQAVLEAPLAVHPLTARYCELYPDLFEITVADWDSHPIATELGIAQATQQPKLAFRASFNFDIQLGLEVWRAPT
jgi:hypothetical protein